MPTVHGATNGSVLLSLSLQPLHTPVSPNLPMYRHGGNKRRADNINQQQHHAGVRRTVAALDPPSKQQAWQQPRPRKSLLQAVLCPSETNRLVPL